MRRSFDDIVPAQDWRSLIRRVLSRVPASIFLIAVLMAPVEPVLARAGFDAHGPPALENGLVHEPDHPLVDAPAPDLTSASAFAVDLTSGDLLYSQDADERRAPASTLKIVTALTAIEILDPDEEVIIQSEDLVDITVYANAGLQEGDIVSVRDLLAGTLIPSGGDSANALAREAGERLGTPDGSDPIERFVEEMNTVARDLGMQNSNFVNPDGSDAPDQYTTARDLAIASEALMRNALLLELVGMAQYEITISGFNARSYEVYNTNELIGIERVQGIKTGTTGEAGECLVMLTTREGNQILTVVMGSEQRYEDTQALLDHIDQEVTWVELNATERFPSLVEAAERYDFMVALPVVRPFLTEQAEGMHTLLYLGPRPERVLPTVWGYIVFLHDGEELHRVSVMTTV